MNDGTADYPGDDNEVNEDGDEADEPVTIVSKPENFSVRVGSSVRLECKISPATQNEIVQWTKGDDEGLFFNRNPTYKSELRNKYELYHGTQDLIIKDVNVNDTDRYTCKILQTDPVSVTHRLIVTVPPMIESTETTTVENVDDSVLDDVDDKQPRIISFMVSDNAPLEGSQVVFTCKATGVPKPSIIWARRRNGEQATENLAEANGEFHDQTFFMRNVTKDDSGVYFCYAINDAGNATAQTVTLTVYGKPRVHAHKTVINSDIDVEAVLKCSTHDGPHEISWFKDGRRIHSDTSANFKVEQADYTSESTLTVIPKTNEDFGTFTCEASNRYGSHSKSIKLTNRPIIEGVDFEGGKLTFTVHSHQPLLKIEAFLQGEESKTSLEIPVPETESKHTREVIYVFDESLRGKYELTLRAANTNGWGDATDAIFVNADLEAQPQIKTAQVLGVGSGTHSVLKSPSFFLNTIMMYLLVRTLL